MNVFVLITALIISAGFGGAIMHFYHLLVDRSKRKYFFETEKEREVIELEGNKVNFQKIEENNKIEELIEKIENKDNLIVRLEKDLENLNQEKIENNKEIEEKNKQILVLSQKIEELEREVKILLDKNKEFQERKIIDEKERGEFERYKKQMEEEVLKRERENEILKEKVGLMEKELGNYKNKTQELNLIISDLEKKITSLEDKIQEQPKAETKYYPIIEEKNIDDLKVIDGIGPKLEEVLKANGVKDLRKLAKMKPEELKYILEKAGGDRYSFHNPASWPNQAKVYLEKGKDEFEEYKAFLRAKKLIS